MPRGPWPRVASVLAAVALLAGCGHAHESRLQRGLGNLLAGQPVGWRTLIMPAKAPRGGFAFECTADGCRIESDTGTYTWLSGGPTDPPGVARFALTAADRDSIWGWLLDADFFDLPRRMVIPTPYVPAVGQCMLRVEAGGHRHVAEATTVTVLGTPLRAGRGGQLATACDRIRGLVERKPAVSALPKPVAFHPM